MSDCAGDNSKIQREMHSITEEKRGDGIVNKYGRRNREMPLIYLMGLGLYHQPRMNI